MAHSVDLKARQRRYLISMGIRTVCFVCAVIATGPLRWFFVFEGDLPAVRRRRPRQHRQADRTNRR
ncbi:MAG: DUF3099 domain-containing protein [Nocardioidaceae bacterium]